MKKSRIAAVLTAVTLVAAPALIGAWVGGRRVGRYCASPTWGRTTSWSRRLSLPSRPERHRRAKAVEASEGRDCVGGLGGQVIDVLLTVLPGQSLQVDVGARAVTPPSVVPGVAA